MSPTSTRTARKPVQYFGPKWDYLSFGDGIVQMPVPVGRICPPCEEEICTGDRGYMDPEPTHLECALLAADDAIADVTGQAGYGGTPNPDDRRTYRQRALDYVAALNESRAIHGMGSL